VNDFISHTPSDREARPGIPPDLIEQNAPSRELPARPEEIYPTRFYGSRSRRTFRSPLIRQDPIFIVGYPRSGTTLVQALIATQENVVSFEETHFFGRVRKGLRLKGDRILPDCLADAVERIRGRVSFSKNAERHVRSLAETTGLSPKMFFETIVIDNLAARIGLSGLRTVRWMEKTPEHVQQIDVIRRYYPRAQFIYVMRDPEKSILSRRKHFTFNQEAGWPIEKHAEKWLHGVRMAEKYRALKPQAVLIVKLEDITRNPVEEVQKICRFLHLRFDRGRLDAHKEVAKTLYYPWETWKAAAGEEILPALALREDEHLCPSDRQKLNILAGPELKRYGYLPAVTPVEKAPRLSLRRLSPDWRRLLRLRKKP
jgi:Sulfotransferase family